MNVTDDDVKEMNDRNEYLKKEIIHLENQITNLSNDIQSAKTECEIYLAKESVDTPSKYSDKISYNFSGERLSNLEFFRVARKELGLNWESCWFIYEMNVRNLDELHFKAVIVNKEYSESYHDSAERKEHWISLID